VTASIAQTVPASPYKGLVPFEETELDALLFFGREREREIIAANVLASRLTVLYGPTGVGKTSVLRAGVAWDMRRAARLELERHGHPSFAVVVFDAWSEQPAAALRVAAREALADLFGSALLDEVEEESLADTFERWTNRLSCELLLVLDQAEEYFLYHAEEGAFANELPELVTRPGLRVRALLSIRDDALAKLDRFKGRIPNLFANYLRLDHLDTRAARSAIVGPVERYNELVDEGERVELEAPFVDAVLEQTRAGTISFGETGRGAAADAEEGRIEAPYLQLVLERVWDEERAAGSRRLRRSTLERLGGTEAIVGDHLRRAVEELTPGEKDLAAEIFRYLVTPSGTKIAHGLDDLSEYAAVDEERLRPVLSRLGRERILRPVDGASADALRYEIYHDVLADAVLAWRREREVERHRHEAQRRQRRLIVVAVGSAIVIAALTVITIFALAQRHDARTAARLARGRELAARAGSQLQTDPMQSLRLAIEAAGLEHTAAVEDVLRDALMESHQRASFSAGPGRASAVLSPNGALIAVAGPRGVQLYRVRNRRRVASLTPAAGVRVLAFSPDGHTLAAGAMDGSLRLWRLARGHVARILRGRAAVTSLAFSPDGALLATGDTSGSVTVRSVTSGARIGSFQAPAAVRSVEVSPDDRFVLVVSRKDRSARLYRTSSGALHATLSHLGYVTSASFSPKGRLVLTTSVDHTARTWETATGYLEKTFKGHVGQIVDGQFSPRGRLVVTASTDGTARVSDAADARLVAPLIGHGNFVLGAAFSPDGHFVVTASKDGTARVWTTQSGKLYAVLAGHRDAVTHAVFARDGRTVLTESLDGTARIWDAETKPQLQPIGRHAAFATSATFSPDGKLVVSASTDGSVRIWKRRGGLVRTLRADGPVSQATFSHDGALIAAGTARHEVEIWRRDGSRLSTIREPGAVRSVAFSPDSRRVVVALVGAAEIRRVGDGHLARRLPHPGIVTSVAFSPDGLEVATADTDHAARVWSAGTGRLVHLLRRHKDIVESVQFSPDGTRLVTAGRDHDVVVWDARTGNRIRDLQGHFSSVNDASFSRDGRWIVTASGEAGLWQVRTGRLLGYLTGHVGYVSSAAFAPDGEQIVTAGQDGTVRTYRCDVCGTLDDLVALARSRLSRSAG
jgi:WD40 repeat protein